MKHYNLLVFDWDGTLVDSEGLTIASIQEIASDLNHPVPKATDIRKHFGSLLADMLQELFPEEDQKTLTDEFNKHFTEEKLRTYFFKDVVETLTYLKQEGFTLAIATNRARAKLDRDLDNSEIKNLFTATRCPEDGAPKPNPYILLTLLKELKIRAQDALMIGDTIFDMQFANNAKVDALAACYGLHRKEQLQAFKPVGFIENINELKTLLPK